MPEKEKEEETELEDNEVRIAIERSFTNCAGYSTCQQ